MPEVPHGRPMRQQDRDNYIYQNAPAGIKDWVEACAVELERPPKRLDVVKSKLILPEPDRDAYLAIGVYKPRHLPDVPEEHEACFDMVIELPLPTAYESDFRRPPEPRTMGLIGTELEKLWDCNKDCKECEERI